MGTQLDRLAAYKAAVADQSPSAPIRIRLSYADALAVITEHGTSTLRHPEAAEKAISALGAALASPVPEAADVAGVVEWAKAVDKAGSAFWDAVHGEEINGVEILRKQA
jgi:hypothetical protein